MKITIRKPYGISEIGQQVVNEDNVIPTFETVTTADRLFILSDGQGRRGNGDMASQIICSAFDDYFKKVNPPKKRVGQLYMNEALRYAERKLHQYTQQNPSYRGIAGTVALIYFNDDDTVSVAWVGDSRVYVVRNNQLLYRTDDHMTNVWDDAGKRKVVPRTISGSDPVWISSAIISDIQPNDYFFLSSQGISQSLQDRNIKYLLSQGDGTDKLNKDIIAKIQNVCSANSKQNYSAYLIQIENAPAVASSDNPNDKYKKSSAKGMVIPDEAPPAAWDVKYTPEGNEQNIFSSSKALALICLILLAVGVAFGYKYTSSRPTKLFNEHMDKSLAFSKNSQYDLAIQEIQEALKIDIEDTVAIIQAKRSLGKAKEQQLIQKGDQFYQKNNLLEARTTYENVLGLNPKNRTITRKLETINQTIDAKKMELLVIADSLLTLKNFKEAKKTLYDALYLDQENEEILQLVNSCNISLQLDTITLADAVEQAIAQVKPPAMADVEAPNEIITDEALLPEEDTSSLQVDPELMAIQEDSAQLLTLASPDEELPPTEEPKTETVAPKPKKKKKKDPRLYAPLREPKESKFYREDAYAGNGRTTSGDRTYKKPPTTSSRQGASDATPYRSSKPVQPPVYRRTVAQKPLPPKKTKPVPKKPEKKKPISPTRRPDLPIAKTKPVKTIFDISYDRVSKQAKDAFAKGDYRTAKRKYQKMLEYRDVPETHAKIAECKQKISVKKEYVDLITKADDAYNKGLYATAQKHYRQALNFDTDDKHISKRIEQCSAKIIAKERQEEYSRLLKSARLAFNKGNYAVARQKYQSILPDSKGDNKKNILSKIEDCNRRIKEMEKTASKRKIKKAEKYCKQKGYSPDCYNYLKKESLFYSVKPTTLVKIAKSLEGKNKAQARECYSIAADKGSTEAQSKLEELGDGE